MKLTSSIFKRKCEYYKTWFFVFYRGIQLRTYFCTEIYLDSSFVAHKRKFVYVPAVHSLDDLLSSYTYNLCCDLVTQSKFDTEFSFFKDFIRSCSDKQISSFYRSYLYSDLSDTCFYSFISSLYENSK